MSCGVVILVVVVGVVRRTQVRACNRDRNVELCACLGENRTCPSSRNSNRWLCAKYRATAVQDDFGDDVTVRLIRFKITAENRRDNGGVGSVVVVSDLGCIGKQWGLGGSVVVGEDGEEIGRREPSGATEVVQY
jgi:hypothetical protein